MDDFISCKILNGLVRFRKIKRHPLLLDDYKHSVCLFGGITGGTIVEWGNHYRTLQ